MGFELQTSSLENLKLKRVSAMEANSFLCQ